MPNTAPVFLHMLGIPGSGKTTFLTLLEEKWHSHKRPVLLGFDQVMNDMPAYQAVTDKVAAFSQFELPARELGYKKLDELIEQKISILFDNGGSSASHIEILKKAVQQGYRILLVAIDTAIADARRRVDSRAVTEGRHTPLAYLDERADKLERLKGDYRALTPYYYNLRNEGYDLDAFHAKCLEVIAVIQHDLTQEENKQ